jgi:hypothetical protein
MPDRIETESTTVPSAVADDASVSARSKKVRLVAPVNKRPTPRDTDDQDRANEAARGGLDRVRKAAENWRTGMAGLITLVTGTLLFKGRDSINGYQVWVRGTLGALVGLSLVAGIISLLLFLNAAYGQPRVLRTQEIADSGGIDAYNFGLAQVAVDDLKWARRWALGSVTLLAFAIILAWYGPATSSTPPAFAKVTYTPAVGQTVEQTKCGVLQSADSKLIRLHVTGERNSRNIKIAQLVSIIIVSKC